ncbi:Serine hydroxymethyltransferase [Clarias magur]|uniref:Serine hydroxymethyltransferase n=1 Tax=Clarias magur TaxID=1594786 RepID=A0A8J4T2U6_CLAMG|nr:Serine hydroxymethyltransferase [Clarias magur]
MNLNVRLTHSDASDSRIRSHGHEGFAACLTADSRSLGEAPVQISQIPENRCHLSDEKAEQGTKNCTVGKFGCVAAKPYRACLMFQPTLTIMWTLFLTEMSAPIKTPQAQTCSRPKGRTAGPLCIGPNIFRNTKVHNSLLRNKDKLRGMFSLPRKPSPNQKGRGRGLEVP